MAAYLMYRWYIVVFMHSDYVLYGLCYNHYSLHLVLQPRTRSNTPLFFCWFGISTSFILMCVYFCKNLQPLSSAYGLAKHRDGRWEWAIAPGVSPSPRYQHAAVSCLLICSPFSLIYLKLRFIQSIVNVMFFSSVAIGFCQCTASCLRRGSWGWSHGRRLLKRCRFHIFNFLWSAYFHGIR